VDTPNVDQLAELKRQRAELDQQITDLAPTAITEGFAAGMRPEELAARVGYSVSRIYQLRRRSQ